MDVFSNQEYCSSETKFISNAFDLSTGMSCSDFVVGSNNGCVYFAAIVVSVFSGNRIEPFFHLPIKLP